MSFEPEKFFIGVIDFFSILLPGALLTFVLKGVDCPGFSGLIEIPTGNAEWVAFLFVSYLLGHFIFLIASKADDCMYDPLKERTKEGQIKRLSVGKGLSSMALRGFALVFGKGVGSAVRHAQTLRDHYLGRLGAASSTNAFQWCKNRLTLLKPGAMSSIERFEADSKFFRSLMVVLFIFLVPGVLLRRGDICSEIPGCSELATRVAIIDILLFFLAFWRYVERRVKATNQAYSLVIALEAEQDTGFRFTPPDPNQGPTHAGGVVYRIKRGRVEYLLVQAKLAPHAWVLPKGHIEPWEPKRETAVREVREETRVWARVQDDLEEISFIPPKEDRPIRVHFYLMEALEMWMPAHRERQRKWCSLDEAKGLLKELKESVDLMDLADRKRVLLETPGFHNPQ